MGYDVEKFSVWKFSLEDFEDWGEPVTVSIPVDAEVLTVRVQTGLYGVPEVVLYAKVDPEMPTMRRAFALYPTGHEWRVRSDERMEYIGTVEKNSIVVHIFEVIDTDDEIYS
jgi:hypothetical protein